jgi:hypothetical protein
MSEDLTREEVLSAVDGAVEELLAAAGIEAPPVDALDLARRHLRMAVLDERNAPRRRPGSKQIVLSPDDSEERRQWVAAQAIGAERKPALLAKLGIDPAVRSLGESLANLFAEHLLVPALWFADDVRSCGGDLLKLKKRYRTAAHETIAFRLLDLPEPCVISIVEEDRVQRRRSNGPRVTKQLQEPERECQQHVTEHDKPHVVRRDRWIVQGWPVGGQRVVLRSVVEME